MAKKSYKVSAQAKSNIFKLLLVFAVVLLLGVVLPEILPNAENQTLVNVIDFFVSVKDHFVSLWPVYFFLLTILVYGLKK